MASRKLPARRRRQIVSQWCECRAELGGEQHGMLPRCEVTAPICLVEVGQVSERTLCPRLWGPVDLLWEHGDGHRDRDLLGLLRGCIREASSAVFPVDPR